MSKPTEGARLVAGIRDEGGAMPVQLLVQSDETSADLHIMGNIYGGFWKYDDEVSANDIAQALAALPETCQQVTVHINSMGGDVSHGVAIYNALRTHRAHVTTVVEGFACSIASVIFMGGDERVMRDASLLMIHNAWMYTGGNAKELRKAADDLDTITELSKRAYMARAKEELTRELLDQLMDAETWILPERAVELGLADVAELVGEGDGPEQSAMDALVRQLTRPCATNVKVEQIVFDDEATNRIASEVARQLTALAPSNGGVEPSDVTGPEPERPKSFMQRAALMYAAD
jgi:ATP-dependent protease ClpP protease subunit